MAVEMVRKPSETPNIENIDDFMPIRYAYANQNGYVIGRGRIGTGIDTEAYTINGNTFTINSGRLVLQGVECDINTEHSIVIDVNATKRYCAIYLEVNLATNTSDIFVAYDMLGTSSVDVGDDLTINPVGTARMVLFTCEATNGLISNVVKVVKACEYPLPCKLDKDGVLMFRDIIIPQEKILFKGKISNKTAEYVNVPLNESLNTGDYIEIIGRIGYENNGYRDCVTRCYVNSQGGIDTWGMSAITTSAIENSSSQLTIWANSIKLENFETLSFTCGRSMSIKASYPDVTWATVGNLINVDIFSVRKIIK